MKCSDGQVGRYQSIYNNLGPEAMERFKTGEMVISTAAEMSGLDRDRQREALKKSRVTLEDIRLLKQQEKTVSESDTENISDEEIWQQEENSEMVSESDTEKTSLAAVPEGDMVKTAASSEPDHIQSFGSEYTQEDVETVYREQTEMVQQFEYIMADGNMTAADYKRYKKALIIRDGISYMLKTFGKEGIC